jgi:hypothetical protein
LKKGDLGGFKKAVTGKNFWQLLYYSEQVTYLICQFIDGYGKGFGSVPSTNLTSPWEPCLLRLRENHADAPVVEEQWEIQPQADGYLMGGILRRTF